MKAVSPLVAYMLTFGLAGIVFVAVIISYVFPVLAGFVIPTRKRAYLTPGTRVVLPR